MNKYKVDFQSINWESPIKGVRQKVFKEGQKQIRLVEYSQKMPSHWCEKGHWGYILEGVFEIEFADGKQVFKAGDGVFIPDGKQNRHNAKVVSDKVISLFVEDI